MFRGRIALKKKDIKGDGDAFRMVPLKVNPCPENERRDEREKKFIYMVRVNET